MGIVRCENPLNNALGLDASSALLVFECPVGHGEATLWGLEIGRRRFYGINGLATDAGSVSVCRDGWGISLSVALLSAPVGREGLSRVAFLWTPTRRIEISPSLRVDTVSFDGFRRSYLVSASVRVFTRVSDDLILGSAIDRIRIHGESSPGADAVCHAIFFPDSPLCGLIRLCVSNSGRVGVQVSSRLRITNALVAAAGYEDDTGVLKGSVALAVTPVRVSVGADIHPVLGVSESIFLSWGR